MLEIGWNLRVSTPRSAFPGKATGRTENSFFRLGGSTASNFKNLGKPRVARGLALKEKDAEGRGSRRASLGRARRANATPASNFASVRT